MTGHIKKVRASTKQDKAPKRNHSHGELAGVLAGEVVGGVVGSLAGPPGAVAGLVIGAAVGAVAGAVIDREANRAHEHDDELDEEIGVTTADMGAPNLKHLPVRVGAFSSASVGTKVGSEDPRA